MYDKCGVWWELVWQSEWCEEMVVGRNWRVIQTLWCHFWAVFRNRLLGQASLPCRLKDWWILSSSHSMPLQRGGHSFNFDWPCCCPKKEEPYSANRSYPPSSSVPPHTPSMTVNPILNYRFPWSTCCQLAEKKCYFPFLICSSCWKKKGTVVSEGKLDLLVWSW